MLSSLPVNDRILQDFESLIIKSVLVSPCACEMRNIIVVPEEQKPRSEVSKGMSEQHSCFIMIILCFNVG